MSRSTGGKLAVYSIGFVSFAIAASLPSKNWSVPNVHSPRLVDCSSGEYSRTNEPPNFRLWSPIGSEKSSRNSSRSVQLTDQLLRPHVVLGKKKTSRYWSNRPGASKSPDGPW